MYDDNYYKDLQLEEEAEAAAIEQQEMQQEERREELVAEESDRYAERMDDHFAPREHALYV